jgi:hypothetical protein
MPSRLACAGLLVWAAVCGLRAEQDATTSEAASMKSKLVAIAARGTQAPAAAKPLTTSFTDHEVNAYFKLEGPEFLPEGLQNPQIAIDEAGRVSARATIDFDQALKNQERSLFNPLAWLHGKSEVTAAGVVHGANGKGTLTLEQATLGGVGVPVSLLQQIVTLYTRTPETPQGIDLTKPFDLPSNIRSIQTRRGSATIVQ